jgi:hypothetical protein
MSCINPNSEIYAEIRETLETLGSKFQNAWNLTLRVYGGALEESVLSYAKIIPNVQVLRAETHQTILPYRFSGNPRRIVRFWRKERRLVDACAMGSSRPML